MEQNEKAKHVHGVFEKIAPKYDLMNDVLSFRRHKAWRKFTMRKMNMKSGQTAIDLCCGTCDWTLSIAEASGSGRVVGLDFSQAMLDVGKRKVVEAGRGHQIELIRGNAMELPFPDDSFDFATIGFGLRNVPDFEQVLREMKRVVKPGGKVVCLELSKPTWQPFKGIYYFYFQQLLPQLGKLFAKSYEQYKWLPDSLKQFPDRHGLTELFRKTGLESVSADALTGGIAALHIGTKGTEGK
ncbi:MULTISPECIES: demethylmenaquinone methyltransferase [unclassified Paenibacillus]|uniref:demethylmenaquinone methyltransferase n=1 Tax=unclassified Paenibacillus TaxID=185978 RepID=UPI000954F1ED|nr:MULTISPECIES: demethylmenaquinone methyltransferase [unclassified Paenibacillus]ASS65123.1 demethylmenaquinone methyltransferase [Paenibacillus sp. RUD330]SIQ47483.1 demethylmenaquinone methyltransferase / 2-methoxy-6-polyprenyl-1,4-benzoquinol methylase [Paenibacillus sp. RU4X]SIQ69346.1 demethylmenaquinone methyltransferase / 2-methoxy-6-polyprenyl-1,4-benzoquinol methylase [Paenibacillus sp. RU4T]